MNNEHYRTTMDGRRRIIVFLLLVVFFFLLFNGNNRRGKILCQETKDGYTITLYDKQNNIIDTTIVPEEPIINQLTDNIFEIAQSCGSPARYSFYYDIQNCKISDVFFNPIIIENKYIAYFENNELIISDLFHEGKFYKKIKRDYTKTADPISAVIGITLEDEKRLIIEYYQGEDYIKKTEIIELEDEKENK